MLVHVIPPEMTAGHFSIYLFREEALPRDSASSSSFPSDSVSGGGPVNIKIDGKYDRIRSGHCGTKQKFALRPELALRSSQMEMNVEVQKHSYSWSARRSPAFMLAGTLHGLIPAPGAFSFKGIIDESFSGVSCKWP